MNSRLGFVFPLLTMFCLVGCNPSEPLEKTPVLGLKLDPRLSQLEREALNQDLARLQELKFSPPASQVDLAFRALVESEENPSGVLGFLQQRIRYVTGEDEIARAKQSPFWSQEAERGEVVAINLGGAYFLEWVAGGSQGEDSLLEFGEERISIHSPRSGIMALDQGYLAQSSMARQATLIHEARHSDCSGGYSRSQIQSLLRENKIGESAETCGHLHQKCPEGHPLEGIPACDGHPWGAYSAGGLFSASVHRSCENCTERERAVALIDALDAFSRVLVLDQMLGDPSKRAPILPHSEEVRP